MVQSRQRAQRFEGEGLRKQIDPEPDPDPDPDGQVRWMPNERIDLAVRSEMIRFKALFGNGTGIGMGIGIMQRRLQLSAFRMRRITPLTLTPTVYSANIDQ